MSKEIKFPIPDDAVARPCRGCGKDIYWIVTEKGKRMPVDPDGTSHFATCSAAGDFRKGK